MTLLTGLQLEQRRTHQTFDRYVLLSCATVDLLVSHYELRGRVLYNSKQIVNRLKVMCRSEI